MSKFDVRYIPIVTYPATLKDIVQDICNQCGVELGSTEFRNSNKTIESNPFLNAEQCREVIKSVAKVSFSTLFGIDIFFLADQAVFEVRIQECALSALSFQLCGYFLLSLKGFLTGDSGFCFRH